jgi:Gpi18-like mannosyltransferase
MEMQKAGNPRTTLLQRAAVYSFQVFLVLRVATLLWMTALEAYLKNFVVYPLTLCGAVEIKASALLRFFVEPWIRWDTVCYLNIAEKGYFSDPVLTVWPPLYPLLIRLLSFLISPQGLAAILISNLATWAAFTLFYVIVANDYGEQVACNGLFLMAIFPTAFFFVAAYTEALFLALMLASLHCARQQRWFYASLFAAAAVLTRMQGVLIPLVLLWEAYEHYGVPTKWKISQIIKVGIAVSLPIIALGAYAIYAHYVVGADWPWNTLSTYWRQHWGFPWQGVFGNLSGLLHGPYTYTSLWWIPGSVLDLVLAVLIPLLLILRGSKLRVSHLILAWAIILPSLMKLGEGNNLISFSRYALTVFPFFVLASSAFEKRWLRNVVFTLGVILQMISLGLFYLWLWVA